MLDKGLEIGLTFDDVILIPEASSVLPSSVDISSRLAGDIKLSIPFLSAAMDTVTESKMAIAMAQMGGIGIIHRNMSREQQALEVRCVKKHESGIISDPITISPDATIREARRLSEEHSISGFPVVEHGKIIGMLTKRDLRACDHEHQKVREVMTPLDKLIVAQKGTSREEALRLMHKNRIEKLPLVEKDGRLVGLITLKDIEREMNYPNATKDEQGRLRVGAAVGVGDDAVARVERLIAEGVDLIAIDTAHGHSKAVIDTVSSIKKRFDKLPVIAGNIATSEAASALISAGADALKVGVGPGSICTTRIVTGVGVPQLTAISWVAKVASKENIPVIADGGIKYSGDVMKALAAGADAVMMGSVLAGTDEAPGEIIIYQGRSYKSYRGMGSLGAMVSGSKDRYAQSDIEDRSKLVPEGIEGRVPYKGPLHAVLYQFAGGLRSGMGYLGCSSICELRKKARFIRITNAGLRESHVHDVVIVKEAPNYRVE